MEVGASGIILDREQEIQVEQNDSTTNDVITTMGTVATEEIGTLEVAFLYDAPMREMTVRILFFKIMAFFLLFLDIYFNQMLSKEVL